MLKSCRFSSLLYCQDMILKVTNMLQMLFLDHFENGFSQNAHSVFFIKGIIDSLLWVN